MLQILPGRSGFCNKCYSKIGPFARMHPIWPRLHFYGNIFVTCYKYWVYASRRSGTSCLLWCCLWYITLCVGVYICISLFLCIKGSGRRLRILRRNFGNIVTCYRYGLCSVCVLRSWSVGSGPFLARSVGIEPTWQVLETLLVPDHSVRRRLRFSVSHYILDIYNTTWQ